MKSRYPKGIFLILFYCTFLLIAKNYCEGIARSHKIYLVIRLKIRNWLTSGQRLKTGLIKMLWNINFIIHQHKHNYLDSDWLIPIWFTQTIKINKKAPYFDICFFKSCLKWHLSLKKNFFFRGNGFSVTKLKTVSIKKKLLYQDKIFILNLFFIIFQNINIAIFQIILIFLHFTAVKEPKCVKWEATVIALFYFFLLTQYRLRS